MAATGNPGPLRGEQAQEWLLHSARYLAWAVLHGEESRHLPADPAQFHDDIRPLAQHLPTWDGSGSLSDHLVEQAPNEATHLYEIIEARPVATPGPLLLAAMQKAWAQVEFQRALITKDPAQIGTALDRLRGTEGATSRGLFAGVDPSTIRAGRYLAQDPPPLHWVFRDSLLAGTVGLVVGTGGVGKSTFMIMTSLAVASGQNLTGQFDPQGFGAVLAVYAEEDDSILHRRTRKIATRLGVGESACDRVHSIAAAGHDIRLVRAGSTGSPEPTQAYHDLCGLALRIPNLRLIILDPMSRLFGLQENDNSGPTVFIALLERLAQETGAAVLICHHTKKAGKDGTFKTALEAEALRGASAFTGAVRWQMNLTTLKPEEARKELGAQQSEWGEYLAGRVCKKNYGPPEDMFFLRREDGGLLRPCEAVASNCFEGHAEALKDKIREAVGELDETGQKMTKSQLGYSFAPKWKTEGVQASRESIKTVVEIMLQNGELKERRERSGQGKKFADYLTLE